MNHHADERTDPPDHPTDADAYARAAGLLGMKLNKRLTAGAFTGKLDGRKVEMHAGTLRAQIRSIVGDDALPTIEADDAALAAALAVALDRPAPHDITRRVENVVPLLRPALATADAFTKAARTAVRREAFDDAFYVLTLGASEHAHFLRTEHLDHWGWTWEDAFAAALDRLDRRLGPDNVHEVEGDPHLLAVIHDAERTDAAHLLFHRLIEPWDHDRGAVFAVPTPRTCLVLPVREEAGAPGLARLVRTAYALTPTDASELRRGLFWKRHDRTDSLSMTHIEESDGARVQLEAVGPVAELLRALGEIE